MPYVLGRHAAGLAMLRNFPLIACCIALVLLSGCRPEKASRIPEPPPPVVDEVEEKPDPKDPNAIHPNSAEAIAKNNHGVALMGRYMYAQAREVFEELVDQCPQGWTPKSTWRSHV